MVTNEATEGRLTPEQFLDTVADTLQQSTPDERRRLLSHARVFAVVEYRGDVPETFLSRLQILEARWLS